MFMNLSSVLHLIYNSFWYSVQELLLVFMNLSSVLYLIKNSFGVEELLLVFCVCYCISFRAVLPFKLSILLTDIEII